MAEAATSLDSSREQAVSAAGTAAQTIFSFSSDKLQEHESASKALMTKSFAKDFAKVAPALTEVTENRKIVVKAVAREAAPLACGDECSADKVDVLVFLDQARLVGLVQGADGVRQPDLGVDGQDRRRLARQQHPRPVASEPSSSRG